MTKLMQKLRLVLWKNLIIRKFHWLLTLLELVIPIALFLFYAVLNSKVVRMLDDVPASIFPQFDLSQKYPYDVRLYGMKVFYSPRTNFTKKLMDMVSEDINDPNLSLIGLNNEPEIESTYESLRRNHSRVLVLGIVFEESSSHEKSNLLQYKIRAPHLSTSNMYTAPLDPGLTELYFSTGFASLQYSLDKSYINLIGRRPVNISLVVQEFPIPKMARDPVKELSRSILPLLTILSFIFLCPSILKRVVEEKTSGVKELMKLMGMKTWMCWFGWVLNSLIPAALSITIIVILLKIQFGCDVPPVLDSCGGVMWCFLMLYCLASVFSLFTLSTLFQRPTLAMMCGLILWIGSFVAGYFAVKDDSLSFFKKMIVCGFPNIALQYGYNIIFDYETSGGSFKFSDLAGRTKAGLPNELNMWHVWLMFIIDSIVFYIFTLYIEAVRPGDYGIAKPWYFPCLKSTWRIVKVDSMEDSEADEVLNKRNFEPCSSALVPGIKIQGLRKVFRPLFSNNTKVAVDGITLDIYQNQITALLGHNGAGKSTTMLILTGMYAPTGGTIYIDGYDVRYHMSKVRESLGLCPQQNMLFTDLTVKEHLVFFGMLKGYSMTEARRETEELLEKLSLAEHQLKRPEALSGGMKRRLCLGIALCGNPKVVILDEPTSGLDPEARRKIWDLLLSMRGERTIIITTHIMEEADVLGDRIAIMDHGRIQCYGTSIFLKKLYGTGYQLQITKEDKSKEINYTETIQFVVPEATVKRSLPTLITYNIPSTETHKFPALFSLLENKKMELKMQGMGLSITTLEEVFLKVGENVAEEDKIAKEATLNFEAQEDYKAGETADVGDRTSSIASEESMNSLDGLKTGSSKAKRLGLGLLVQQINALFIKRWLFMRKSWMFFLIQVLFQVVVMICVTHYSVHQSEEHASSPLQLTLDKYGVTDVLYTHDNGSLSLPAHYENTVKSAKGLVEVVPYEVGIQLALLKYREEHQSSYVLRFVAAAEFNMSQNIINALYLDSAVHSVPISINLVTNALLKDSMNMTEYSIAITSHPFKEEEASHMGVELVTFLWNLIPPYHIFWMGIFMVLPVKERVSESKQVQLMTGLSPITYWLTYYIWDLMLNLIITALMVGTVACVDTSGIFSGPVELSVLLCILIVYGLSAIPFSYLVSYVKNTVAGCYAFLVMSVILSDLILRVMVHLLANFQYIETVKVINSVYYLIPVFAFSESLTVFSRQVMMNNECKLMSENRKLSLCSGSYMYGMHHCCSCTGVECEEARKPYIQGENNPTSTLLIYMAFSSILYFIIILLIEWGVFQRLRELLVKMFEPKMEVLDMDSDVLKERTRIQKVLMGERLGYSGDALLIRDLLKKYSVHTTAVKGLSFGVRPGECFGLVGVNGAGKTTTFKMLTGGAIPTVGDATIGDYSLSSQKSKYLAQIGYCPQYDPLIDCFTGWELLEFFARLRGVVPSKISAEVRKWIKLLDLTEYQYRKCGTYSGGNKRKLSTAIALIGSPPIVFLDEPTSGVDPISRRKLWSALLEIQKAGQSIVLTSHSMEECEALCNRLAIMVKGKLQCLGSIQHLKQKFGQGFTIKLKLDLDKSTNPKKIVELKFEMDKLFQPNCFLKDEHQSSLHYHVTKSDLSWSYLFTTMEDLKKCNDIIEDYTISETTLEQVFLSFAKDATDGTEQSHV